MSDFHRQYRAWAVAQIQGVEGSGAVFPYAPVLSTWDEFVAAFDTGERDAQGVRLYRGWVVQIVGAEPERTSRCDARIKYNVELRYYSSPHHGYDEPEVGEVTRVGRSELDVWDHILDAVNALAPSSAAALGAFKIDDAAIQGRVAYVQWSGSTNLAHTATLTQAVTERLPQE